MKFLIPNDLEVYLKAGYYAEPDSLLRVKIKESSSKFTYKKNSSMSKRSTPRVTYTEESLEKKANTRRKYVETKLSHRGMDRNCTPLLHSRLRYQENSESGRTHEPLITNTNQNDTANCYPGLPFDFEKQVSRVSRHPEYYEKPVRTGDIAKFYSA